MPLMFKTCTRYDEIGGAAGTVGNALRGVPGAREGNILRYPRNGTEAVPYSRFAAFRLRAATRAVLERILRSVLLATVVAAFGGRLAVAADPRPVPASGSASGNAAAAPAEPSAEKPKPVKQLPDGRVLLLAREATVHGTKLRYEPEKSTLGYWMKAEDWVSWEFEITKPSKLFVDLMESCGPETAGTHYAVDVGNQKLTDKVQDTGSFRVFRLRRIGGFEFEKPGVYTLSVRPIDKPRVAVMDLRAITLQPVDSEEQPPAKPDVKQPPAPNPAPPASKK